MTKTQEVERVARMVRTAEAFGDSKRWNAIIDRAVATRNAK